MRHCQTNQEQAKEKGTFDVGTDVELVAAGAKVDLRRRLVNLGRRADETHG